MRTRGAGRSRKDQDKISCLTKWILSFSDAVFTIGLGAGCVLQSSAPTPSTVSCPGLCALELNPPSSGAGGRLQPQLRLTMKIMGQTWPPGWLPGWEGHGPGLRGGLQSRGETDRQTSNSCTVSLRYGSQHTQELEAERGPGRGGTGSGGKVQKLFTR